MGINTELVLNQNEKMFRAFAVFDVLRLEDVFIKGKEFHRFTENVKDSGEKIIILPRNKVLKSFHKCRTTKRERNRLRSLFFNNKGTMSNFHYKLCSSKSMQRI